MHFTLKKIVAAVFLASTITGSTSHAIVAPNLVYPITSVALGFLFYQRNHYTYKDIYPWVTGMRKVIVDSVLASPFCVLPALLGRDRVHGEALGLTCVVGVVAGAVVHYSDAMTMSSRLQV